MERTLLSAAFALAVVLDFGSTPRARERGKDNREGHDSQSTPHMESGRARLPVVPHKPAKVEPASAAEGVGSEPILP